MTEPYMCTKHDINGLTSYCPECMAEFKNRRPAAELTRETRAAILRGIPEVLTIPFDNLYQWVEELMGRPVWTHEFAHPAQLIEELESGSPAGIGDVIGKLPWDKPVLLVDSTSGNVTELP